MKRFDAKLHYSHRSEKRVIDTQANLKQQRASSHLGTSTGRALGTPWSRAEMEPKLGLAWGPSRRTNAEAIAAGLAYLFEQRHHGRWGQLNLPWGIMDAGITACVLARLAELPSLYISASMHLAIADSLDWLQQVRSPQRGWGYPGQDDVETTAWAVIALRKHSRPVPHSALELLRRCRRLDGGFAYRPEAGQSAPEPTALGVQALGSCANIGAAAGFISSWLASDEIACPLLVCSEVLDWEKDFAPTSLLDQAYRLATSFQAESALEQALLLRCLLRLRLNRAWPLAAGLRAAQLEDGSWPSFGLDDKRTLTTATAVSALALGDFQPGLYFGSDRPRPRRLHES